MTAIGVIPARWGSTRFPGKSLAMLAGRPLLHWVIDRARAARRLERVLVATDDERIVRAAEAAGAQGVMTRPDHPSGTDRVAEAVALVDAGIVVNVQGDEPLLDPGLIDRLVEVVEVGDWDMSTAVTPLRDADQLANPGVVKAVWGADGRALYFSRAPIPFVRDGDWTSAEPLHWRHLGVYAYRREFLVRLVATPPCANERAEKLEQLRALHIGGRMAVVTTEDEGIGVDTPADLAYVEALMQRNASDSRR